MDSLKLQTEVENWFSVRESGPSFIGYSDLYGCSALQHFPKIALPMSNLKFLVVSEPYFRKCLWNQFTKGLY